MTPVAAPLPLARATEVRPAASRSTSSLARRRRALLHLARRRGEVRLRVGAGCADPTHAADVSELLDDLNQVGLLRYGGLADGELLYTAS